MQNEASMLDTQYIKNSITLSSVVKDYVELKRSGSSKTRWVGLCPFHQEKTPSFCVSDDRCFFKCFGCGESGDVLTFLQKINGVDFKEAISQCKQIAGIKDEYLSPQQQKLYQDQMRKRAAEAAEFRNWRAGLIELLIYYTNGVWRMYREKRKVGEDGDDLLAEGLAKEKSLSDLENMPEKELMEYYKTQKSWVGVMNPGWYLSKSKRGLAHQEKVASHV